MADGKLKVFISGVTSEFGTVRDAVAGDLHERRTVRVQKYFSLGGDAETLLERLHDYIRDCREVICIVGRRSGESPPPEAAEPFTKFLPKGIARASYTQWELLFARHYKRRLYTYVARPEYKPDRGDPTDTDALQQAFLVHLNEAGVHYKEFSDAPGLRLEVSYEDWSEPPSPPASTKPIVLPYPSLGHLFKGREGFMRRLHESLRGDGKTAITGTRQALYGLGGIGKTRAAVEYAWAHESDYSALLFVVAETPEALRANLVSLTKALAPQADTAADNVRLQAVLGWLASNPGWLLILDNVDTREAMAAVEDLLKDLRGGRIIVTSRRSEFSANFAPLSLDVLPIDDAAAFLLERTEGRRRKSADDNAKAKEIAKELDGLALALEQAGAYIAKRHLTFDGYLQHWRSAQHDDVLKWFDQTVTGYPKAVAVTWQTSVAQLTDPGRRMLERLAWLAPEKVPEFLLDVPVLGAEDENLHEALADLSAYSLVTRDVEGPFFLVHRLVQDVTRRSFKEKGNTLALYEAFWWINNAFPSQSDDPQLWPAAEALAPHARTVAAEADKGALDLPIEHLFGDLGTLFQSKALYAEAERLCQRAVAAAQKRYGPEHEVVARLLHNLAGAYEAQGRYSEAEPLLRRSIDMLERFCGSDSVEIGLALNALGELHRVIEDYAKAEPLLRRSVAILEKSLGHENTRVSVPLNNLGLLCLSQGSFVDAEQLLQRSLTIREKAFGADSAPVATGLTNLAGVYRSQGRYAEAEPLYERSLAIREKVLGPNHDDVANSLYNLGQLYSAQGRHREASSCLGRCVRILFVISRQIGRDYPYLPRATESYAAVLQAMGKSKKEIDAELEKLRR